MSDLGLKLRSNFDNKRKNRKKGSKPTYPFEHQENHNPHSPSTGSDKGNNPTRTDLPQTDNRRLHMNDTRTETDGRP